MILNRKIIRNIKNQKVQYLGSMLLILLSCMLFIMFNIMGLNIIQNLEDFKENYVQEDANFILEQKLDNIPSLEDKYNLLLEKRWCADYEFDKKSTLRLLNKTEKINRYAVLEGEDIKNANEILIDPGFAKEHNIKINQQIKLFNKAFIVKGFVSSPDYIYPLKTEGDMVKNPAAFGIAIMLNENFNNLNESFVFYSVKYKDNISKLFKNYIEQNNTVIQWTDRQDNMRISFIEGDLKGVEPMGKVIPIVILLITCILVSVVIWRLLKQEFSQIGVLYALGYRKIEILKHYLLYSTLISVVGSVLGTAAGSILVKPFISYVTTFYSLPIFQTRFDIKYILISVLLPFIFLIPTTILVVWKALKLSPLQLLKGEGNKIKISFWERKLKLQRFKFNTKFKIREVVRNIPRTILMVLGVTFASALLLVGFSMKDSMDYLMNNSFIESYNYKYQYVFNSLQTEKSKGGEMSSFSAFTSDRNKNKNNTFIIYGIPENATFINLKDSQGNKISLDKVIITKPLAEKNNLHEGDTFHVKSKVGSKEFSIKIDKIADFYLGEFVYMPLDYFNSLNDLPKGSYMQMYSNKKLDIEPGKLIFTINSSEMIDGYKQIIKPFQYLIGIIGIMSFIIGLIIIYIVTSLIIEENKETVSLLKILGYQKKEIFSMILDTNTILVIIGYILSISLVLYSLDAFFKLMTEEMNIGIPVKLNNIYLLVGLVFIFLTYETAKFLNRKKIINISMADSLKSRFE